VVTAATNGKRARFLGRAGLAGAALGCALATASCAADPVAAVRSAGTMSMKIGSAEIATSVSMSAQGRTDQFSGTGTFDFAQQLGSITLTVPADVSSHSTLDEVITPTTLYMRPTGTTGKWVRVDSDRLADGDLISAGYTSPILAFAMLGGAGAAGGSVSYVGQDKVYDVPVAHYTGTLDLIAAAKAAPAPENAALVSAGHSFTKPTVPFDVYLDAQGRVLRFVAHFQFPAPAPEKGEVTIVSSTDLYDLGKKVAVTAPSPADVLAAN
jgi:polyisoprenoid-binding protein YceI